MFVPLCLTFVYACAYVGLDYHFYREEIYMTQENHCITRIPVMLVESSPRNILRSTAGKQSVLHIRAIYITSITVDPPLYSTF